MIDKFFLKFFNLLDMFANYLDKIFFPKKKRKK